MEMDLDQPASTSSVQLDPNPNTISDQLRPAKVCTYIFSNYFVHDRRYLAEGTYAFIM
jgi:hypothetical protein